VREGKLSPVGISGDSAVNYLLSDVQLRFALLMKLCGSLPKVALMSALKFR
jgi:hypothetical protein